MSLSEYNQKRDFSKTSEPRQNGTSDPDHLIFVVQKHAASHLHYDFRLEMGGVLKSWAIPKGPSTDPQSKRLAMMVEDHPYAYHSFEGNIPKGEYGGGSVIVWDEGYYEPIEPVQGKAAQQEYLLGQLRQGSVKVRLHGKKLHGEFALVKTHGMGDNGWLLIKHRDGFDSLDDVTLQDRSVISGKNLQEIADGDSVPDRPELTVERGKVPDGPVTVALPKPISPMLATLADEAFDDERWQFEVKWDGYRAISYLSSGTAEILSRNGRSFNERFAPLLELLKKWPVDAVLDGEIVVIGENGKADFSALQNWHDKLDGKLVYYVFDILSLNKKEVTGLPLSQRRALLEKLPWPQGQDSLRLGTIYPLQGKEAFEAAQKQGQEGIVAKRLDSVYLPGKRSRDWLKIKVHKRQEVVIAGFMRKENSPRLFSALLLGLYRDGGLHYVGKVGTGFSLKLEKELMAQFTPLLRELNPFSGGQSEQVSSRLRADISQERASWLEPVLVCEVSFSELTKEGFFRHPSFKGMRVDKKASAVALEEVISSSGIVQAQLQGPERKSLAQGAAEGAAEALKPILLPLGNDAAQVYINGAELSLGNLQKLYWPEDGISKRDMINYYHQVSGFILPYLKDRPLSLNRFPNGIHGQNFYQKDVTGKAPEWMVTFPYSTAEGLHREYAVGEDEQTLIWMAALGCIEMNPWFSRLEHPDRPDYAVIDLDPDEHNSFADVVRVALEVRDILKTLGVPGYCKTSGSTGIHVYIPLGAKYSYDQSQGFIKTIVTIVNQRLPELTSLQRPVAARGGKMYLDFLQNKPAATVACPYSLRPKPGAPVSTPLHWDEVHQGLDMYGFNIGNTARRLDEHGDLFAGVLCEGIDLEQALAAAAALLSSGQ